MSGRTNSGGAQRCLLAFWLQDILCWCSDLNSSGWIFLPSYRWFPILIHKRAFLFVMVLFGNSGDCINLLFPCYLQSFLRGFHFLSKCPVDFSAFLSCLSKCLIVLWAINWRQTYSSMGKIIPCSLWKYHGVRFFSTTVLPAGPTLLVA